MVSIRRQAADFTTEWRKLMAHFDWVEGFSLVVLFVPDTEGAAVRRRALERYLASKGKSLVPVTFNDPEELKLLANRLLNLDAPPDAGAVWVEAVIHETDERFEQWEAAWREGVARLNQYRNPLRRKFHLPLVFVAAPWAQEVLRGMAPDLWSVRALVVNIEPGASAARDYSLSLQMIEQLGGRDGVRSGGGAGKGDENQPDPELALNEAARLRGRSGQELNLAALLYRAGRGFIERSDWTSAVESLSEAADLYDEFKPASEELADSIFYLARALMEQYDHNKAKGYFEEAREIYREIGTVLGEANCIQSLGDIALKLSDKAEARRRFEEALELYKAFGDPYSIGWAQRRLARLAEDESERASRAQAAREAWESIDRPDLVQKLEEEIGASG